MQLIIDIPEEEYKWIKKSDKTVFADVASKECMLNAIKNGKPLPKGYRRLISEENMLAVIMFSKLFDTAKIREVKEALLSIPTIIEADGDENNEVGD